MVPPVIIPDPTQLVAVQQTFETGRDMNMVFAALNQQANAQQANVSNAQTNESSNVVGQNNLAQTRRPENPNNSKEVDLGRVRISFSDNGVVGYSYKDAVNAGRNLAQHISPQTQNALWHLSNRSFEEFTTTTPNGVYPNTNILDFIFATIGRKNVENYLNQIKSSLGFDISGFLKQVGFDVNNIPAESEYAEIYESASKTGVPQLLDAMIKASQAVLYGTQMDKPAQQMTLEQMRKEIIDMLDNNPLKVAAGIAGAYLHLFNGDYVSAYNSLIFSLFNPAHPLIRLASNSYIEYTASGTQNSAELVFELAKHHENAPGLADMVDKMRENGFKDVTYRVVFDVNDNGKPRQVVLKVTVLQPKNGGTAALPYKVVLGGNADDLEYVISKGSDALVNAITQYFRNAAENGVPNIPFVDEKLLESVIKTTIDSYKQDIIESLSNLPHSQPVQQATSGNGGVSTAVDHKNQSLNQGQRSPPPSVVTAEEKKPQETTAQGVGTTLEYETTVRTTVGGEYVFINPSYRIVDNNGKMVETARSAVPWNAFERFSEYSGFDGNGPTDAVKDAFVEHLKGPGNYKLRVTYLGKQEMPLKTSYNGNVVDLAGREMFEIKIAKDGKTLSHFIRYYNPETRKYFDIPVTETVAKAA